METQTHSQFAVFQKLYPSFCDFSCVVQFYGSECRKCADEMDRYCILPLQARVRVLFFRKVVSIPSFLFYSKLCEKYLSVVGKRS